MLNLIFNVLDTSILLIVKFTYILTNLLKLIDYPKSDTNFFDTI